MYRDLHGVDVIHNPIVSLKCSTTIARDRQGWHDQSSQSETDIGGGGLNDHNVYFPQARCPHLGQCQLCKLTIGQHRCPESADKSSINKRHSCPRINCDGKVNTIEKDIKSGTGYGGYGAESNRSRQVRFLGVYFPMADYGGSHWRDTDTPTLDGRAAG